MSESAHWITLGKDRYYQHPEIEQWCHDNIGLGGWSYDTPKTWEGMGSKIWVMHSMFGNTTYVFKDPRHLTHFILRWSY